MHAESIAIIGRSCVAPASLSPSQLWDNIVQKRNCLSHVPPHYWGIEAEKTCEQALSDMGGYILDFDKFFDATEYQLPAEFIKSLDPLFHWLLYLGSHALADAGYKKIDILEPLRAGIIVGNLSYPLHHLSRYAEHFWFKKLKNNLLKKEIRDALEKEEINYYDRFMSALPVQLLSLALGITGQNFAIDAACASGLYAIKLACDRLQDHRADLMLAGGVNHVDDLYIHLGFSALKALSSTGQSRPFQKKADGLVPAEGAGMLVLKRLNDAIADKNPIYGIIEAIGLSNDGKSQGFLLPSKEGQMKAMTKAYQIAGIPSDLISWVECHATGTVQGDAVEISSMQEVFNQKNLLSIGTLKGNLGHLITASGILAVIKVLEAFRHQQKPPSLYDKLDLIPALENSPFHLHDTVEDWPLKDSTAYAAINAFGFGGNDAHLILSSYHEPKEDIHFSMPPNGRDKEEIALIGIGLVACACSNLNDFIEIVRNQHPHLKTMPDGSLQGKVEKIALNVKSLHFPPNDLQQTLGQQLLVLKAASDALDCCKYLDYQNFSAFIGMECDTEICQHGLRWRLPAYINEEHLNDKQWLKEAQHLLGDKLHSAHVLGEMPNIITNRLNNQFNLQGPSFSVSAEELSGIYALETGIDALRSHDIHIALVGAVDMCCTELHQDAAAHLLDASKQTPGDAAIVFILKRLSKAQEDGDTIYAVFGEKESIKPKKSWIQKDHEKQITSLFGHAHAANGCMHLLAAMCLHPEEALEIQLSSKGRQDLSIFVKTSPQLNHPDQHSERSQDYLMDFPTHIPIEKFINWANADSYPSQASDAPLLKQPPSQFNRKDLEILASQNISQLFGSLFQQQDDYYRQVRMPEPPLLLADRVCKIEAEPGVLKKGTIWTQTDVREHAWYLHHHHMSAGMMIESGQADLLLISWMGIDFHNKGKRVYRLLGCEAIFHGGLPKVGDTLSFEIHIDNHMQHGDTRLFFFHYTCHIQNELRLEIHHGQAGFFSDEELKASQGVLWDIRTADYQQEATVDPPLVHCSLNAFDYEKIQAFREGKVYDCFGKGFELCLTHTRTPLMHKPNLLFWHEVTDFNPGGGLWKRGYIRARQIVKPDDWFFKGHFKNDPCMPGTLMLDAGLTLIAFYLTALGTTLDKDGWRFEPVEEERYKLICRGQVIPSSKEVIYELFIESFVAAPIPEICVHLLSTVDGLKCFYTRIKLKLIPDWPLLPKIAAETEKNKTAAFQFDPFSLEACALGKPSDAFGPTYARFDNYRSVPRLPGFPYHFMSRISKIVGEQGVLKTGCKVETEYDVPAHAWYFNETANHSMPFSVLMEICLQPCGWLSSYAGSTLQTREDLKFRNLDGSAIFYEEISKPTVLTVHVEMTGISKLGSMIIETFLVRCTALNKVLVEMNTVFGLFPYQAFENQPGLNIPEEEKDALSLVSDYYCDLRQNPKEFFTQEASLPGNILLMIDRLTGFWPKGGKAHLGRMRAEKIVNPADWFFKAHFFQDPVQPGSLGLEAMLQVLQCYMIKTAPKHFRPLRFEPISLGKLVIWKYRGQVVPSSKKVVIIMDITKIEEEKTGVAMSADGSLWVDGKRIYEIKDFSMRLKQSEPHVVLEKEVIDLNNNPWLGDHCPTYTVPVLPMMTMVDRLASAAKPYFPEQVLVGIHRVQSLSWGICDKSISLLSKISVKDRNTAEARLDILGNNTKDIKPYASATLCFADEYPCEFISLPELEEEKLIANPYEESFHGKNCHFIKQLWMANNGSRAYLEASSTIPFGYLNQGLLDSITHCIPNTNLSLWSRDISSDQVAYPYFIPRLLLFRASPKSGELRCEIRFKGFYQNNKRFPCFNCYVWIEDRLWLHMEFVEILYPKGPLANISGRERRKFLQLKQYVPNVSLSKIQNHQAILNLDTVYRNNWIAGTLEQVYEVHGTLKEISLHIAIKENLSHFLKVHPAEIQVLENNQAFWKAEPQKIYTFDIVAFVNRYEVTLKT